MFLFWGPDSICFYNDAYRASLGNDGKHPKMLGEMGKYHWQETWHFIKPLIDNALNGGEASLSEDQLIPIYRYGRLEDVFWTFSYSSVVNDEGKPGGAFVTCFETTQKVITMAAIKERESQINYTIEAAELGTWDLDPVTNKFIGNAKLKEWFGLKNEQEIDLANALDVIVPNDRQKVIKAINDALEGQNGGYYEIEYTIVNPLNNIERRVLAKGKALFDENKSAKRFSGILQDLSYQKKTEKDIARFKYMADNAQDAFILVNENGGFSYINKLALERWGYTEEEAQTISLWDINPTFTKERFDQLFIKAQKEPIPHFESIHRRKNGEAFPIEINVVYINMDGEPYIFAIARDISERKKIEEELKLTTGRFKLLADSMPQHVWTAGPDGDLNYFNQSVMDFSGLRFEQLLSGGWIEIVHPEEREENVKRWVASINTGKPFLFEHRFKRHDGEYRWQLSRAIPQKDEGGNIKLWVGTSTDIHDHRLFADELENKVQQRTLELKLSNENLIRSNEELAQFSYVASHDLQEPLRKIQTFSSRILDTEATNLSEKGKDYFNRMLSASVRMQQLILDLLSYSRANTSDKYFELTNLNEILQNVKNHLKESFEQKGTIILAGQLPEINVIRFQFEQLFTNILSNSLKFSKKDVPLKIVINACMVDGQNINQANLENIIYHHISISDNGIGFGPEFNERIFNLFQRLHGKDEYKGTGIGLAICKKILENHQGLITASGKPGLGATFNIYIPVG